LNLKSSKESILIEKAGSTVSASKTHKQMRGFVKGGDAQNIRQEEDRF
jgi:hypothetical protein